MSLFPRFHEVSPLLHMFDEFDRSTRQAFQQVRAFQPKFDIKEGKDSYELHGEFPGIEEKDIAIEWQDGNTLTISGRTEHRSERGTPPAGFIEEGKKGYQQPAVEDEKKESPGVTTTVAKQEGSKEVAPQQQRAEKFWATERSVGEFYRSFTFPSTVDQDNVKATLKNGILQLVVPKLKVNKTRKVNIEHVE